MVLHLNWLGTYVHTEHDDRDDVVGRGEIDIVHDQDLAITEARLGADVGLPGGFGASLVLPLRLTSSSIDYFDTAGMSVELTRPGIHHRNESVTGLGDPMVLGWYGRALGDWRLTGRVGFTVPIGRTEEDPFTAGDQGLAHQHIQFGTGTVNPVLAVEASRTVGRWRFGGFGFLQQTLYENGKGYQAGDRYAAGVSARRSVGTRWTVRGGVEAQGETAERWNGVVHTDDGNQGRLDGMVAAGATWKAASPLSLDLGLKIPVVTHVVGGQLDMPAILELGATWTFGARGEARAGEEPHDHDHGEDEHGHHDHGEDEHGDHEHGDPDHAAHDDVRPDTTGLDVADVAEPAPGQALVPVPGKVTIFDVWATWCAPCKTLEPVLVDMVRAQPDRLALRRVDVSTSDEWTIKLPYVVVFDATGTQILAVSSDGNLDALIAAVRAAVEPKAAVAPPPQVDVPSPPPPPKKPARAAPPARVSITVTEAGFHPGNVTVPAGKPVRLVFHRTTDKTCATEVVMTVAGKRIEQALPLNRSVELRMTFPTAGTITYACAMDMIRGTITVK